MINVLIFICGFILGMTLVILSRKITSSEKDKTQKYQRRGIMDRSFTATDGFGQKSKIDVQFEVGELERTDKKSKIEIISFVTGTSTVNSSSNQRKNLKSLINNSWVESQDMSG